MGRWVKRTDSHKHDMPGPAILANQEAVPGWEWECECLVIFTLESYNRDMAVYRDPTGKTVGVQRGQTRP